MSTRTSDCMDVIWTTCSIHAVTVHSQCYNKVHMTPVYGSLPITTTTATTTVLQLSGLSPGLPGWAGTRTNLDFTKARDSEWQWHQLGHMQICTSPQTDVYASTPPLSFFTGQMPFPLPNQWHQRIEGINLNVTCPQNADAIRFSLSLQCTAVTSISCQNTWHLKPHIRANSELHVKNWRTNHCQTITQITNGACHPTNWFSNAQDHRSIHSYYTSSSCTQWISALRVNAKSYYMSVMAAAWPNESGCLPASCLLITAAAGTASDSGSRVCWSHQVANPDGHWMHPHPSDLRLPSAGHSYRIPAADYLT